MLPAIVAPGGPFFPGAVDEVSAAQPHQQADELFRPFQVELSKGGASEETGEHRLTDIHRIEPTAQALVCQPHASNAANGRLVPRHQFRSRTVFPGPYAADQFMECVSFQRSRL